MTDTVYGFANGLICTNITCQWIRVGDELPTLGTHVLGWNGHDIGLVWRHKDVRFPTDRNGFAYIGISGKAVTHWMPLPAPPRE